MQISIIFPKSGAVWLEKHDFLHSTLFSSNQFYVKYVTTEGEKANEFFSYPFLTR